MVKHKIKKGGKKVVHHLFPNVLSNSLQCALEITWYTDKKENQIFLIYKEIQKGLVAKSYMTNGLLIYG